MDTPHTPSILENAPSKGVVIFIHGFMGSPRQLDNLAACAHRAGFSAVSVLLPGHGAGTKEFSSATMEDWLGHVYTETERFFGHDKIYLVGHSMGSLIAINTALRYSERISGLFLIACPLKLKIYSAHSLSVKFKQVFYSRNHPMKAAYLAGSSVKLHPNIIWRSAKPTAELKKLIRATEGKLSDVDVPVTAVYSASDELVSIDSLDILKTGLSKATFDSLVLSDSLHAYYLAHEQTMIEERLLGMLLR